MTRAILTGKEAVGNGALLRCTTRRTTSRRTFLSNPSKATIQSEQPLTPSVTSERQKIIRYGKGDEVVTLDVGGKKFRTLRSTVESNEVLARYVTRAEANNELSGEGSAIFIDRDPTHFDIILRHLRNTASGMNIKNKGKKCITVSHLSLPNEKMQLKEIYAEAVYFGIPDLQAAAANQSVLAGIMRTFRGGNSNPFYMASSFASQLRGYIIAAGGIIASALGISGFSTKNLSPPKFLPQRSDKQENASDVHTEPAPSA